MKYFCQAFCKVDFLEQKKFCLETPVIVYWLMNVYVMAAMPLVLISK